MIHPDSTVTAIFEPTAAQAARGSLTAEPSGGASDESPRTDVVKLLDFGLVKDTLAGAGAPRGRSVERLITWPPNRWWPTLC